MARENLRENFYKTYTELCGSIHNEEAVSKMYELCLVHSSTPEDFIAAWVAYATSKSLVNEPTLETLHQFERDELNKTITRPKIQTTPHRSSGKSSEADLMELLEDESDDLLNAYSTPEIQAMKRQITPKRSLKKQRVNLYGSPVSSSSTAFSPKNQSPATDKYTKRNNAGQVLIKFGTKSSESSWLEQSNIDCMIQYFNDELALTKKYKFMYEKPEDKIRIQSRCIEDMRQHLSKYHGLTISHLRKDLNNESQTIIGKIWSDGVGKLNAGSVFLDGALESTVEFPVPLDVSNLKEFSFFPGQIISIDATSCPDGTLIAEKLHTSVCLPKSNSPIKKEGFFQIIVAVGPFTTTDSCSFEPLDDLLKYIETHRPNVCILIGPFVDSINDPLSKFNLKQNDNVLCTHEDIFYHLTEQIEEKASKTDTKVIIVPSLRDLHNTHFAYPIPPFLGPEYESIHYVSDPVLLDIEGLIVGITSVDILLHLGKEEMSFPPGSSDRLGRLCRHILLQENFYPLNPPNEDVNIDYQNFEKHCHIPVKPHVLILPSDLKHFIKEIDGCCCINPERLTKGMNGGTFVRMQIDLNSLHEKSVSEFLTAEIIRI